MISYNLYEVLIINDIPMIVFVENITARNIVEAESIASGRMEFDKEYLLLLHK